MPLPSGSAFAKYGNWPPSVGSLEPGLQASRGSEPLTWLERIPFLRESEYALNFVVGAYSCRRTGVHPGSKSGAGFRRNMRCRAVFTAPPARRLLDRG